MRIGDKYIVYRHINAISGDIFYIGIGVIGRQKQISKRSIRWTNYVNKYGFYPDILFTGLTWAEACNKEKELIKLFGRMDYGTGLLINMTDGGDGSTGCRWKLKNTRAPVSEATRKKLSENNCRYWAGKNHTEETKQKISKITTGKKLSEATILILKGRTPWNKGLKNVQVSGRKGRKFAPLSDEHKLKISIGNTGKVRSKETCDKISVVHKGKVVSNDVRAKISNTLKNRKTA